MSGLNLHCPINGTGYGITSSNIGLCLSKMNVDVALSVIGQGVMLDDREEQQVMLKMLNAGRYYNPQNPCLKIWHQHDLSSRIGRGDYYAFPFFEVDKFYPFELHHMNNVDFLFSASEWGKNVMLNNGIRKPIYVAPLGVNRKIFNADNQISVEKKNYVFLHVGKWEKRKSQDVLIEAFGKAFTPEDSVSLWLVPFNPFLSSQEVEEWLQLIENCPLRDKIKVYNRLPTQKDLANVMFHADCGVFISRAEGWNNEIPEMMSMNKPIIATNYSAHTEYCTTENSFLVDVDETEPANDGKWFNGHGNWAKLGEKQLEQTIEHMKFVYNNRVTTNTNGVDTAKFYSWDNTASVIHQTLLENDSYNVK